MRASVMVVCDDPFARMDLELALDDPEHDDAVFAATPKAAEALLAEAEIEAAIVDCGAGSGAELRPLVRALQARRVPLVLLSDAGLPGTLRDGAPGAIHVQKPFGPGHIRHALATAARTGAQRTERGPTPPVRWPSGP